MPDNLRAIQFVTTNNTFATCCPREWECILCEVDNEGANIVFKTKTLFIVGAGASVDAGFPTSEDLRADIRTLLNLGFDRYQTNPGDDLIEAVARDRFDESIEELDALHDAAQNIRSGLLQAGSIDTYIHNHSGNEKIALLGKLAIVRAILKRENQSWLNPKQHKLPVHMFETDAFRKSWYSRFQRLLLDDVAPDDLHSIFQNLSFIVFNYDRCIENFLCNCPGRAA